MNTLYCSKSIRVGDVYHGLKVCVPHTGDSAVTEVILTNGKSLNRESREMNVIFIVLLVEITAKYTHNYHRQLSLRIRRKRAGLIMRQRRFKRLVSQIQQAAELQRELTEQTSETRTSERFYFAQKITHHYDPALLVAIFALLTLFIILTIFMCCKVYTCASNSTMENQRARSILETMETRGLVLRPIQQS